VKILVADDNRSIPKKIEELLKDQGIEVVGVGHGEAAVKKLPEVQPDLVLADVFMPVRNGYEVCEFVKNDQRFSHIPVVLLVGAFDPVDQHEVKRVKADGLLKKPFEPPDDLLKMVEAMRGKAAENLAAPTLKAAGPKVADTLELSAAEMEELVSPEKAAAAPAVPVDTEPEEYAVRPARIEFEAGEEPLAFGEMLSGPVEAEEEGEKVEGEEKPRAVISGFRASAVPDIEFIGEKELEEEEAVQEEPVAREEAAAPAWGALDVAPEEAAVAAAPAEAEVAAPEAPQWGGIETPPREPSPEEPPIPVEFGAAETLELVTEESAPAPSIVEAGPLPELAATPTEFVEAAVPPAPPAEAPVSRLPVVEVSEAPVEEFGIPMMEEMAEASVVAEAAPLPFAQAPAAPSAPAPLVPQAISIPAVAPAVEAAAAAQTSAPISTGGTDAFARAHVDAATLDAVVEKVIERLQKGVLDQITRDILRPIVEALVAREIQDTKK